MEKDILGKVIEVEKEIQERLRLEKSKSKEWLEGVKREVEEEIAREEERLKGTYNKAVEDARADAEKNASEIFRDAATLAERCHQISDETLKQIIMRHIITILPEEYGASKKAQDFLGSDS